MSATGEYIRMTNYVDDIAATLRRIVVGSDTMSDEERKKLAAYIKQLEPNYAALLQALEGSK
jgi:mono/diheme cytochrome c family protein